MSKRQYELIYVLRPDAPEDEVTGLHKQVAEVVERMGGTIEKTDQWGRRKLAYEIRKKKEGIYTLIRFKGEPAILPVIQRRYQLHENLLRHIIVLYEAPPIDTGAGQNPGFNPSHAIIEN